MAGNVMEWCLNGYYDPSGPEVGEDVSRVLRGGAWCDDPDFCRAASRDDDAPVSTSSAFGCVVVPPSIRGTPLR